MLEPGGASPVPICDSATSSTCSAMVGISIALLRRPVHARRAGISGAQGDLRR
jgi:hypothetical protein